jgi:hypothetical protein
MDCVLSRKSGKWVLDGKGLRLLPVPLALLTSMENPSFGAGLPEAETEPVRLLARAEALAADKRSVDPQAVSDRWRIFLCASRLAWDSQRELSTLDGISGKSGEFRWKAILELLPSPERVPIHPHPWVRKSGEIPHLTALTEVLDRKLPSGETALQLLSDQGFHLTLSFRDPLLRDVASEQIRAMKMPTWGEIQREVILPRDPDVLKEAASELLRARERLRERSETLFRAARACPTI